MDVLSEILDKVELTSSYWYRTSFAGVLVKLRRTLLSENFHTPMGSSHCWLYAAV